MAATDTAKQRAPRPGESGAAGAAVSRADGARPRLPPRVPTLSRLRGRDTHLGGAELSHAQFELLIELDERGELSAGELALAARLTPATVTQMLDALAESGHVERARSDSDRRVVVSRLTALGQAGVAAKRAAWRERWERALEDVSPRELRAAARSWSGSAPCSRRSPARRPARTAARVARRPLEGAVATASRYPDSPG